MKSAMSTDCPNRAHVPALGVRDRHAVGEAVQQLGTVGGQHGIRVGLGAADEHPFAFRYERQGMKLQASWL